MCVSVSAFSEVLGEGLPVSGLAPDRHWRCAFVRLHGGGWGLVAGVPSDRVEGVVERLGSLKCSSIKVLQGQRLSSIRFRGPKTAYAAVAKYLPVACAIR